MSFADLVHSINEGSVVTFREYSLDRHERKHLSLEIENAVVQEVWEAGSTVPLDTLEHYYGEGLDSPDLLQLSCVNSPRIVLSLGVNERNEMDVKIVTLVRDFFDLGLQELTVISEGSSYEPSYVDIMGRIV